MEQEQQQDNQLLASLGVEVQQLARAQGIDGAVKYVIETPILDIYPLAERSSLREETVQVLAQTLTNHTWVVSRIFRHWQSVIFECFCSKGSRKQILGWRKNKDTNQL